MRLSTAQLTSLLFLFVFALVQSPLANAQEVAAPDSVSTDEVGSDEEDIIKPVEFDTTEVEASHANEVGGEYCDCKTINALNKAAAGAYKGLFYDNNFNYLCDPCYDNWHLGENFKRLAVGECWTIDLGGEFRLRQHNETNIRTKPLSGGDDNFLLQRTRLYLNAEYSDWFRFYGEAVDAVSYWENFSPRGIEVNRWDSINLFADLRLWSNGADAELWGRGGRQELLYGAQRLVSPLDWSNTRRTFDGAKLMFDGPTWSIDGWWTRPVPFGQHVAGGQVDHNWDHSDEDQDFIGLWGTRKLPSGTLLDAYYLRLANHSGTFVNANGDAGDADWNLLASRLKGTYGDLMWEVEGGFQFGEAAGADVEAGFFTLGLGYTHPCHCWKPTVWAYYDWASGNEDPTDTTTVGTFNQYYPLGHKYFGFMDIIGRQNIEDVNFLFTLQPTDKIKLLAWYHIFHLQENRDALYNAAGNPIYQDPTGGSGGDIGQEIDLALFWNVTPRVSMLFGYSHFWVGDYFDSTVIQTAGTPPGGIATNGADGEDADFAYTQLQIRF